MSESVVVLNPFLRTAISGDSASAGAFGRLRVGNPETLWDSQFQYGKCPTLWDEVVQGASSVGTHLPNESSIEFTVDTGATDYVVRQTRNYLRYKPGKSQLLFVTGVLDQQADQYRRMGLFDDQNGVFVETDGTTVNMVIRSYTSGGVLENRIPQASWNLNVLDGTVGPALDITKAQIFVMDLEWLGVGRVRVGFVIDGQIIYVHQFLHANVIDSVYMTTANLPIRYEMRNYGAQGAVTNGYKQICSTLISEGGESTTAPDSIRAAATDVTTPLTVPDTGLVPAISVRLAPTFMGITNRGLIQPLGLDILVVATKNIYWELQVNPTLAGDTVWTQPDSESIAQYNIDATGISSSGRVIASGFAQGANQSKGFAPFALTPKVRLARSFDASTSDIATLAVRSLDNPSSDVFASLQWIEFAC
jgi:hypothetical protein